jgi:glyoxylase-like metal-dependent hydrolase (beta-lactamase superfamily II)
LKAAITDEGGRAVKRAKRIIFALQPQALAALSVTVLAFLVGCIGALWAQAAQAASPEGMKLYVFTSEMLNIDKSALQQGAAPGKIRIPVAFFLIKHPKGNVMFDTGNNDKIITDPTYWGPNAAMLDPHLNPDEGTIAQLEKLGVKATDINYVITGHFHLDHAGNVAKFPNATLVYQRDEIINAFWPKAGYAGPYIPGDFSSLRSQAGDPLPTTHKIIELNGDLDLFGDGSLTVHRSVGHTPGSEMLVVRLPKTGTIVLTSDACYLMENMEKSILPSVGLAYDPAGLQNGYSFLRRMRDNEGADLIFAHDPEVFKAHKHAPEYYE